MDNINLLFFVFSESVSPRTMQKLSSRRIPKTSYWLFLRMMVICSVA